MEENATTSKATDMVEKNDYENWDEIPEGDIPTVKPVPTAAAAPKARAFVPSPSITGCSPVSAGNLQNQLQGTNQIRILRRPSDNQSGSSGVGSSRNMPSNASMSSQPTKSIAEREEEYLKARKRIFNTTGDGTTDSNSPPQPSEVDEKVGAARSGQVQGEDRDETKSPDQASSRHDDGLEEFETRESLSRDNRNPTHHRINSEGRGGRYTHPMPSKPVAGQHQQFQPPQNPYPLSYSSPFVPVVGYNPMMSGSGRQQSPPSSRPLSPPSVSNNSALLQNVSQRPLSPVGPGQHPYNMGHNPQHYGHLHSSQPLPYSYTSQENSHSYHNPPHNSYGSQQAQQNFLSHSGYIHQNSYKQYVSSSTPHSSPIPNHFPHPHYNYVPASSSLYSQFNANHGPTGPVVHKGKTKEDNPAGNLSKNPGSSPSNLVLQREFENGDSNGTRGKGNEGNYFPGSNPQAFKPNTDMNGMGVPGNLYIPPKGRNGTVPRGGSNVVDISSRGSGGRGRGRYTKPVNG